MALVTLQVIEGLERGQTYAGIPTPVSIGREDDNVIRLNDERISRFHAKIQEDAGRIILTDLDSTNGTRVNGHPVQMRVLQPGDQLSIGRCLLIYGSREEITARFLEFARQLPPDENANQTIPAFDSLSELRESFGESPHASQANPTPSGSANDLFPHGPPPYPSGLGTAQRAELSDLLAYVHEQVRTVLQAATAVGEENGETAPSPMQVDWATWQRLLQLEMELAAGLRKLADPDQ